MLDAAHTYLKTLRNANFLNFMNSEELYSNINDLACRRQNVPIYIRISNTYYI